MKLYYSPASPYVRKVHVLALELGLTLELVPVKVHDMPSDYGRINPVNRIPALQADDGSLVFDSRVICEYLDAQHGHRFLPTAGPERWRVLKLQVLGDGIMDAAVPLRAELNRPQPNRWQPRLAEYERSIDMTLDALEKAPAELDRLNLGTLTVGCALGYLDFRFPDRDWRGARPKLARWFAEFSQRPSMQATVPKQA